MADNSLAALLAGAAKTNANFNFEDLNKSYWQGLDEAYKQKERNLFAGGVPMKGNEVDWDKVSSAALQTGGIPALGTLTTLQKVMTDMGIRSGLQGMAGNAFPAPGQEGAQSRSVSPSLSSSSAQPTEPKAVPANDPTMTISPRQVAAANAPQPPPQQAQLPAPPPVPPYVPRPVQTVPIAPQQAAPQIPMPPQRPMIPQAPVQQAQPQVNPIANPQPPVPQPPIPQPQVGALSPEIEAGLRASGLVPAGRSVADHVALLSRYGQLAQSTGVRDAGKTYLDRLDQIAKFIAGRQGATPMQNDYELSRRQGFQGTFQDFQSQQEAQKLRFAVDQDTMKEVGTQAAQMVRVRPLLDEALRLSAKSGSGYAGTLLPYWSKVVSAFGINPGEVATNTEALRSIAQQLVPLVRQPGATSNYEAQLYLDAVISPGLSEQARVKVGNMIVKLVDRSLAVAKVYRANAGSPDLYDKIGELDKNPIFTPGEKAFLTAAAERTRAANERQPTAAEVAAELAKRQAAGPR
jgi:hypothetical protein